jgi:uncharacterized membrane protein YfcA
VEQEFQGAAFSSSGIGSFSSIQGIADGIGDPQLQVVPFFFDFQFTGQTDLVGFTSATSNDPGSTSFLMAGTRAGFAPAPFSVPLVETSSVSLFPTNSSGPISVLLADVEGTIAVEYDYTAVPEPPTLLLLISALAGSAAGSRWLTRLSRRRSATKI